MGSPFPIAADRYEAFRHWVWSQAQPLVRSRPGRPGMDELELQARWFGGEFGRAFTGTEGEVIEMVQFGHWNRGAGPDFTEVAVRIDGRLHGGALEIDPDVRDWEAHGHGENPAYNRVVLHVFTDQPAATRVFTQTESFRRVPQVLLPQFCELQGPPDFLPEAFPGRCLAPLARLASEEIDSLLKAAAQYRLRAKGIRLRVMGEARSPDQALFQALAEGLGFRHNKTNMAVLAQRCPFDELRALAPLPREARLLGAAGFLSPEAPSGPGKRAEAYAQRLWACWEPMQNRFAPHPRRALRWRKDGMRPLNHPQRRIAALGALIDLWPALQKGWEEPVNKLAKTVNKSLNKLDHPYWTRHCTLASPPLPKPYRLIGTERLRDLLGNVLFPGAIGLNPALWEEYLRLGGAGSNQKLKRVTLRLFGPDRARRELFTRYYHQQQGLLQIYEDFCLVDASECRGCPFPEQLSQWRAPSSGIVLTIPPSLPRGESFRRTLAQAPPGL